MHPQTRVYSRLWFDNNSCETVELCVSIRTAGAANSAVARSASAGVRPLQYGGAWIAPQALSEESGESSKA